ncbi:hypothetical protein [Arcanobacterium haemolyticum]|uniref:hypothetical protein n=1 Tax=Arcanobacterium haemolyticum TaxID=28264 RepID=UPI000DE593D8|nr:hypothetical protein [Arcanobacterium haemolyticum]
MDKEQLCAVECLLVGEGVRPIDIAAGDSLTRNFEIVPIGSPEDVARLLEAKLVGNRAMLLNGANLSILLKNS